MIDPTVVALAGALRLAQPTAIDLRQTECIADAVYHESRGEPLAAQIAVASVVVNRGRPCVVVSARGQFAYRRRVDRRHHDVAAWRQSAEVALLVQSGAVRAIPATHFHDTTVAPAWAARMTYVGRAGGMEFWRAS
ncbi:cell wall hydrolase [Paramagnetospirillum magneticum]|uniref:Cell wall hydrolase SleB domain-containing protein n=1 Tax=Paramagnetospirillum magneticum (strain ATCC 700264 / AMB-1) TaxID=342108 RepID=Q2W3Q6_PARM1|nr:cell wall hydrolase [Paramagnetospirillum magneticum]BAE51519.1 hypothetical protein amb2715 [Paramagnetospirillum magneticum AMB-1]